MMRTRAAVALEADKPLEIMEVISFGKVNAIKGAASNRDRSKAPWLLNERPPK